MKGILEAYEKEAIGAAKEAIGVAMKIKPVFGYDRNQYPDWDRPTYKRMVKRHATWFFISKAPGLPGKTYRKNQK